MGKEDYLYLDVMFWVEEKEKYYRIIENLKNEGWKQNGKAVPFINDNEGIFKWWVQFIRLVN